MLFKSTCVQPVPGKMRIEMVIGSTERNPRWWKLMSLFKWAVWKETCDDHRGFCVVFRWDHLESHLLGNGLYHAIFVLREKTSGVCARARALWTHVYIHTRISHKITSTLIYRSRGWSGSLVTHSNGFSNWGHFWCHWLGAGAWCSWMYGSEGHTLGLKMDQSNAISPDHNSKQYKQYECMIHSTRCLARPGGPGPPFGGVVKTGFSLCASPLEARFGMCNKKKSTEN